MKLIILLPLPLSLGLIEVRAQRQVIQVKKVWFKKEISLGECLIHAYCPSIIESAAAPSNTPSAVPSSVPPMESIETPYVRPSNFPTCTPSLEPRCNSKESAETPSNTPTEVS
jgi:hypothetical protein